MRSHFVTMLVIGLGGFLGANCRYFFTLLVARLLPFGTVGGTFAANFAGSVLLAVFLAWAAQRSTLPMNVRLLVATGFFGSFTTFSSFANEGITLARAGNWSNSAIYIIGTNMMCLLGAVIGLWIGNRL